MKAEVKSVDLESIIPIRQKALRPGKPIESCYFHGDKNLSSIHLGLYLEGNLIGIASILEDQNSIFTEEKQFRLRGMAILEAFQQKGFGQLLLIYAEKLMQEKCNLLWFNARTTATGFYQKMGYEVFGEEFEIENVGPHLIMAKRL